VSKWGDWAYQELKEAFPDLRAGKCNCRKISGSSTWSQHSWCNALDIRHVDWGYSTHPTHQAWLDEVYEYIMAHFDELSIRVILWRRRDHFNHIHIDGWPKGYRTPSCGGGTTLYQWPDGHIEQFSKYGSPDPINGYPELPDNVYDGGDDFVNQVIQRGASGFEVALYQQYYITLGYDLGEWDPYDGPVPTWAAALEFTAGADGNAGQTFETITKEFQGDNSLIVTGKVDGVTAATIVGAVGQGFEWPEPTPSDHTHEVPATTTGAAT